MSGVVNLDDVGGRGKSILPFLDRYEHVLHPRAPGRELRNGSWLKRRGVGAAERGVRCHLDQVFDYEAAGGGGAEGVACETCGRIRQEHARIVRVGPRPADEPPQKIDLRVVL